MRIEYYIKTTMVGSEVRDYIEIPDEKWEDMTDGEKEMLIQSYAFENMEWGFKEK